MASDHSVTNPNRRQLLRQAGIAALSLGLGTSSQAASWPTRPIVIIVPYVAGGVSDMMARLCAQFITEKLGQSCVVENRGGGSGVPAATATANAAPDGHTVLFGPPAPIITVPMLQKVSYSSDSFTPIANFASYPFLVGVKSSVPAKNLQELISYAKRNPGKLNYSSAGVGSISHLVGALFASKAGIDIFHIPYKGAAPATAALIAGEVELYFGGTSEFMPHMSSDRIRVVATTSATRASNLPDIPPVGDLVPGFALETWNGFVGPRGIPQPVVERFAEVIRQAAQASSIVERLKSLGIYPVAGTPAEFAKVIENDKLAYRAALTAAGMI